MSNGRILRRKPRLHRLVLYARAISKSSPTTSSGPRVRKARGESMKRSLTIPGRLAASITVSKTSLVIGLF